MNRDDIEREITTELRAGTDESIVRRDCAFCGRERSRSDDNHAPKCPYWDFFKED